MAFPRSTVPAGGAVVEIARLAAEEGTGRVVVGLPRNMDGTEGSQAAAARAFGQELIAMGLDVSFSDERLTTWEAEERSRATDRSRRANAIDSAAAALILEQYFADHRRHPEES